MSSTIDSRVVEMRFDNKQFESGVSESMSSIKKLNDSLQFKGSTKGFENVTDASIQTRRSLDDFAAASSQTGSQWSSFLHKIGTMFEWQVAGRMADLLVNKLGGLANSLLGVQAAQAGFSEYELKMGSIQTIMAGTGESLETVNRYLNELNEYSDKTIYSFSDMTSNIGKFTNAGVKLDKAVSAIQGVANVAALSGANSNEASRAMYNFAQALSAGYVKLIDWKSIENANMATVGFKEQLIETALAAGTITKEADGMYKTLKGNTFNATKSFNEVLSDQWMTSEVLIQTLGKYSDETTEIGKKATQAATEVKTFSQMMDTLRETAQSGWAQTWEIIFGDFEEGKSLWTSINNVIGGFIESIDNARNEMLNSWDVMGGRQDLLDSFVNLFEGLKGVVGALKDAFGEIFEPLTGEKLAEITAGFKKFSETFKSVLGVGSDAADNFKRIFKGVFAVADLILEIFVQVADAFGSVIGSSGELADGLLGIVASFADAIVGIRDFIKDSKIVQKVCQFIAKALKLVITLAGKITSVIRNAFESGPLDTFVGILGHVFETMSALFDSTEEFGSKIGTAFESMGKAVESSSLYKILESIWDFIKVVGDGIAKVLGHVVGKISSFVGELNLENIIGLFNGVTTGVFLTGLFNFITQFTEPLDEFANFWSEAFEDVSRAFAQFEGILKAYTANIKADTLIKIAAAVAILAASLIAVSFVDSDKLFGAITAIGALFAALMIGMNVFSKIAAGGGGLLDTIKQLASLTAMSKAMIRISIAVLILAAALRVIADLDTAQLIRGLIGVAALLAMVVAVIKLLSNNSGQAVKGATQMVIFAAAIKILASVCQDLAMLSWEELARGLVGVAVLLAAVAVFMNNTKFDGKSILAATGIVIIAAAIKILASACRDFAMLSWEEMIRGLVGVAAVLGEIFVFTKLMGNATNVMSTGIALIALGAAMKIFASAVRDMASMSWGDLAKGLLGMAGAMVIVAATLRLMPNALTMMGMGVGLIAVSTALVILATALGRMGGMSWEAIGKGIVALGGSMLILAVGLKAMNGTLLGTAALLVAVIALGAFVPVLTLLGTLSWGSIVKGLVAIAGAFTILGIAGYVLRPVVSTILSLSAALALIGIGVFALGAGLVSIGAGLASISVGLSLFGQMLAGFLPGIVGIFTSIIASLGDLIIGIAKAIGSASMAIGEAIIKIILAVCKLLVECVPVIADTILKVIVGVFKSLVEYTPQIVDLLFQFIISLIDGLAANTPPLIQSVVNLLMSIFTGALDAISSIDSEALIKGLLAITLMTGIVAALGAIAPLIPAAMIGAVGMGIVIAELSQVLAAVGLLAQIPGLQWLIGAGGDFLEVVGTAIGKFIGGIAGGIATGFTSSLPDMASDLSTFMTNLQPFIDGARSIDESVAFGVLQLMGVILAITGAGIIEGIASWITGGSSVAAFAVELPMLGTGLKRFSDAVAGIVPENIVAAANAAKALAEMTAVIPNEGGIISWFAGENSIVNFALELPLLGLSLKSFSDSVAGISPENVAAAIEAARSLADISQIIPNEGGIVSWFAGDNSIAKFGDELPALGKGLKGFSDAVAGIVPENVSAAASAARSLAEMAAIIPNEGGMVAWFTGENSISKFGSELPLLGYSLKGFSDAVAGIVPENITAAATAAKALAEMTASIPKEGGMAAWFVGETSMSKFSGELGSLGKGIKSFSDSTAGISSENVSAAATAAKAIADLTAVIPKEGGIAAWFAGETSIANFANKLPDLGKGIKGFSDSVSGIVPENITAAANAAKALAEMTAVIPKEGGIAAWFTGETSIANFANKLPDLGKGLKGFSDSVAGISPENVTAAANAAKSLAEMANTTPANSDTIVTFGTNLNKFGTKLKSYFNSTGGIGEDSIASSKKAVEAVEEVANMNVGSIEAATNAITQITNAIKGLTKIPSNVSTNFNKALKDLGETSADKLLSGFDSLDDDLKKVATKAMEAFIKGIGDKQTAVNNACEKVVSSAADAMKNKASSFESAGKSVVQGFANGISINSYMATAKAKAMATAAYEAAKKALDVNSPSKIFRGLGGSVPEGFAMGIDKLGGVVNDSAVAMADTAFDKVKSSIRRLSDAIDENVDSQPTIRPVLDLSNVRTGVDAISSMFGSGASVGVLTNVGAINSMMNRRNQNGTNADVVSAINELRKDMENMERNVYNVDGVTYDSGSEVATAVESIVRAVKIGGRT